MMSSDLCYEKADLCERLGSEFGEPTREHWLSLAAQWRSLAADGCQLATTARLLQRSLAAS